MRSALSCWSVVALSLYACRVEQRSDPPLGQGLIDYGQEQGASAPVGLALEISNGSGLPVRVRAGQTFYVEQMDVVASVPSANDRGLDGLATSSDLASLPWGQLEVHDVDFVILPNPGGTFTRRRFYRGAPWMQADSTFMVAQVDSSGKIIGAPVDLHIGPEYQRAEHEAFFIRRLRGIQWTYDCPARGDCTGADDFLEEALVELRNAREGAPTFTIHPKTTALRVTWSLLGRPWTIPLEQVPVPVYEYGFSIDLQPLTPPQADGTYAPGTAIDFKVTLRDGAGNPLHAEGSLPTYNEAIFGENEAGIQYYRAFFDPSITYWRRKHRERMMMAQLIGPVQKTQTIRSFLEIEDFLGTQDVQTSGLPSRDGLFAQVRTFPTGRDLFGGAFDPMHTAWDAPVPDTWTFEVPADAEAGTYLATLKARRVYLGEDIPFTRSVEIQVGTPERTIAKQDTGGCATCHKGNTSLGKVLHANENRAACNGCHAPLGFEHDAPVFVRVHFLHSRSQRFGAPLTSCSQCHLSADSIERTSKAACLSCHTSYPADHVTDFGPIESPFVGGGRESFNQCTAACHTTHPGSRL